MSTKMVERQSVKPRGYTQNHTTSSSFSCTSSLVRMENVLTRLLTGDSTREWHLVGCETGWVRDTKTPQQQSYELTARKSVTHQEELSKRRLCMCQSLCMHRVCVCVHICSGSRLRQCPSTQSMCVCMLVDLSVCQRIRDSYREYAHRDSMLLCLKGKYRSKSKAL